MPLCLPLTHTSLQPMAFTPPSTPRHIPHIPLSHVHTTQCSLCQTLLQSTSDNTSIPPARTHLHWLYQHQHSQARIQPPRQTQATAKQPPNFSRTISSTLAFQTKSPSLQHYLPFPPRHLRSSMDLRTPPHPRLATHTQLAIHPTSPQTQSIRMAICKTPHHLHSYVHTQTPFPKTETTTKHY